MTKEQIREYINNRDFSGLINSEDDVNKKSQLVDLYFSCMRERKSYAKMNEDQKEKLNDRITLRVKRGSNE